jgi:hypothetical protein
MKFLAALQFSADMIMYLMIASPSVIGAVAGAN